MTTIDVKDANGATVAVEKPLAPGRAAASASRPVALSSEDAAFLDGIETALAALGTQTTSAAILAKIIAAPATEAKQDNAITQETEINTALGTVTASPTANTVLARLKDLLTGIVLAAGSAIIGKVGIDQTTPGTTNSVAPISGQAGVAGGAGAVAATVQRVTLASDDPAVATLGAVAGAKVITDANGTIQQYLRGLISQWIAGTLVVGAGSNLIGRAVADASAATGGIASTARLASAAASTNGTLVKGSAGRVYSAQGYNAAAYPVYLVLYDAVTNPPVPGTTTIRKKIPIPAGSAFALDWPVGLTFTTGIGYALTKLAADADTTAVAAADVLQLNIDYV